MESNVLMQKENEIICRIDSNLQQKPDDVVVVAVVADETTELNCSLS